MKIYTKTGDRGETGMLGGRRVAKHDLAIETCGALDEANCTVGSALVTGCSPVNTTWLLAIQADLFAIGSTVAAAYSAKPPLSVDWMKRVAELETRIDEMEHDLPPMDAFILPGGAPIGAQLHLARSVVRRAERRLVQLSEGLSNSPLEHELVYLNRLSDLLFVMARWENHRLGAPETKWQPRP